MIRRRRLRKLLLLVSTLLLVAAGGESQAVEPAGGGAASPLQPYDPGRLHGSLHWSTTLRYGPDQEGLPRLGVPEIRQRLELNYSRFLSDYQVEIRGGAEGVWGASPFNREADFAGSLHLDEAFVMGVGPSGVWTVGRQAFLLPHASDDYRRLGLLVGNPSISLDGVSWYRTVGRTEYEAAAALLNVVRDGQTGALSEADVFLALRAAGTRAGKVWQLEYAPTLVVSDVVASTGWSLPFRLRSSEHLIEGEVARYDLTGTSLLPTGWKTAWLLRYQPHRSLPVPLRSVEVADVDLHFIPHLANFADRKGRLDWRPGERGVNVRFYSRLGEYEVGWKRSAHRGTAGTLEYLDSTRLSWFPAIAPPLTDGSVSMIHRGEVWELLVEAGAGVHF